RVAPDANSQNERKRDQELSEDTTPRDSHSVDHGLGMIEPTKRMKGVHLDRQHAITPSMGGELMAEFMASKNAEVCGNAGHRHGWMIEAGNHKENCEYRNCHVHEDGHAVYNTDADESRDPQLRFRDQKARLGAGFRSLTSLGSRGSRLFLRRGG